MLDHAGDNNSTVDQHTLSLSDPKAFREPLRNRNFGKFMYIICNRINLVG